MNEQIQQQLRADSIKYSREDYCERCGDKLDSAKAVWLELNFNTGRYSEAGTVPEAESQGCFAFGSACARAVLKADGENSKIRPAVRAVDSPRDVQLLPSQRRPER